MSTTPNYYLNFHALGEPDPPLDLGEQSVCLRVQEFEEVLDAVKAAVDRINVGLTFDDGNRSDVDLALPALLSRGLTARFFVLTGYLDKPGFLDRKAVRELHEAGMPVGSHGIDHRSWTSLTPSELAAEVGDSKKCLEDILGVAVDEAACPFGGYDRRVLRCARQAGYKRIYTSDRGPAEADGWLLARTTLHPGQAFEESQGVLTGRQRNSQIRRLKLLVKRLR